MMSSQASDLQNILEIWEFFKNLIQVLVLDTKELWVWARERHIIVHVQDLEDETNFSKITTFIQIDEGMCYILVVNSYGTSIDKINGIADNSSFNDALALTCVLVRERGAEHGNKFVISFISKLWVNEKYVKLVLEWLK